MRGNMIGSPLQNKILNTRKANSAFAEELLIAIENNNQKFNSIDAIAIAKNILNRKALNYNDKSILKYFIDDRVQNDLNENEIISFKFSLLNFKKNFGWYSRNRNDDWQIYNSMTESLKNGIMTRRDYDFLKSQFSSKHKLVKKLNSLNQGDLALFNKRAVIVVEPLHFYNEKTLAMTILIDGSETKIVNDFLFKIKKPWK